MKESISSLHPSSNAPSFVGTPLDEISHIQHHLAALENAFDRLEKTLQKKLGRKEIRNRKTNKFLSDQGTLLFYDHLQKVIELFRPCVYPNKEKGSQESGPTFSEMDRDLVINWIGVRKNNLIQKVENLESKISNFQKIELNSPVVTQLFVNFYQQELARQAQLLDMSVKREITFPSDAEMEEKIIELKSSYSDKQKEEMKESIKSYGGAKRIHSDLSELPEKIENTIKQLGEAKHQRDLLTTFEVQNDKLKHTPITNEQRKGKIEELKKELESDSTKQKDIDFLSQKSLKSSKDIQKCYKKITQDIKNISSDLQTSLGRVLNYAFAYKMAAN